MPTRAAFRPVITTSLIGLLGLIGSCTVGDREPVKICTPGTASSCICLSAAQGKQVCGEDGVSLGECNCKTSPTDPPVQNFCEPGEPFPCGCEDDVSKGTKLCNSEGTGPVAYQCDGCPNEGGGGGGGAGGDPGTSGKLYAACAENGDCESGFCGPGFCTVACEADAPCGEANFCVPLSAPMGVVGPEGTTDSTAICLPGCVNPADCRAIVADSFCISREGITEFPVKVCSQWAGELPEFSSCDAQVDCSNGVAGSAMCCDGLLDYCFNGGCDL